MIDLRLQHRLFGSSHRVHWTQRDAERIARHLGVDAGAIELPSPPARSPHLRTSPIGKSSESPRTYSFTISTPSVDRIGDMIALAGWRLSAYRKNPVVLWAHDSGSMPVGKATSVGVSGGALRASMTFTPSAREVQCQVDAGVLRATSVGFAPISWEFSKTRPGGIDFFEAELLEFSILPIPANPEALIDPGQIKAAKLHHGGNLSDDRERRRRKRERELEIVHLRGRA